MIVFNVQQHIEEARERRAQVQAEMEQQHQTAVDSANAWKAAAVSTHCCSLTSRLSGTCLGMLMGNVACQGWLTANSGFPSGIGGGAI